MFKRIRNIPAILAVVVLSSVLLYGCSDRARNVLNADQVQDAGDQNAGSQGPAYVRLSMKSMGKLGLRDLVKTTVNVADGLVLHPNSKVERDAEVFRYHRSGDLWAYFGYYADYWAGEVQVKEAKFIVNKYSVPREDGEVKISMAVYSGYSFEDVWVKFEPSGFNFLPDNPATLKLTLRGKDVPEDVRGYHAHGAEVEEIEVDYEERNGLLEKRVIVTMTVPGFSEYSLAGDDWVEADGP